MIRRNRTATLSIATLTLIVSWAACGGELLPPMANIKTDRPRILLRPSRTPYAISLPELNSFIAPHSLQASVP